MNRLYAILYAAFMLLALSVMVGGWAKGVADLLKARRLGEVRTGSTVGKTVYRAGNARKFRSVLFFRTAWLVVMPIGLAWFSMLVLVAVLGAAL